MKIKFLLLIAFCLLGLCISQEMDPEIPVEINEEREDENNKNEVEEDEEIERTYTIWDIFHQSKEVDRLDGQEMIQLFQREKLNGGQCFLDVIQQIQEQYFDWYEKELSCYKKLCKITSKIPSSSEWSLCKQHSCDFYFQNDGRYINELKYSIEPCLENHEQKQTKSNNNNIKQDEYNSSHSDNDNDDNNNNDKSSQQNPSQKENQKTASSSKSDSDNQNVENSENLENLEKTFSCILSFLLLGINIVLF